MPALKAHYLIALLCLLRFSSSALALPPGPGRGAGGQNEEFVVRLLSPISTRTARQGDAFTTQVISPSQYQDSIIQGRIRKVRAAHKRHKASIAFKFETLTPNGGVTHVIKADLISVSNPHMVNAVDEEG
jgi:hypothetical protein